MTLITTQSKYASIAKRRCERNTCSGYCCYHYCYWWSLLLLLLLLLIVIVGRYWCSLLLLLSLLVVIDGYCWLWHDIINIDGGTAKVRSMWGKSAKKHTDNRNKQETKRVFLCAGSKRNKTNPQQTNKQSTNDNQQKQQ